MKIIVMGVGQVGYGIIENLYSEDHDLVVIDQDQDRLNYVSSKYDLLTICGSATDLKILDRAGLKSANLVIAVTDSDEINILACKIASDIYNVQFKIARLRKAQYLNNQKELFGSGVIDIDYIIEPTLIVAETVNSLINYPGLESYTTFINNNVASYICEAQYGGNYIGMLDIQCHQELAKDNISLVGIIRNGLWLSIRKGTPINAGDKIVLCSSISKIKDAVSRFQRPLPAVKKVILAGCSQVNYYLAQRLLDKGVGVKIIEQNVVKASWVSAELPDVLMIKGDCTDEHLLFEECIDRADLFIAATQDENINIFSSMMAKKLGCKRAIALINRANTTLAHNNDVDLIYSGQNDIANVIRSKSHVTSFDTIYRDAQNRYQIAEFTIEDNLENVQLANIVYSQIKLPSSIKILGYFSFGTYHAMQEDTILKEGYKVLVMCDDAKDLKLFNNINAKSPNFV